MIAPGMRMASSTALAMAVPTAVMPLSPAPLMPRARTKSSKPDLLAKFVSVPIYNGVGAGPAEREIASAGCSGEWMTLIEDLDLATYCGRIGNLYIRAGLSRLSPFVMQCKGGWRGTFRSRIVDVPKFPYRTIALKLDAAHLGAHEIPR